MKAIIYYSLSNRTKHIIDSMEGDVFEIKPSGKVPRTLLGQFIVLGFFGVISKSRPIETFDIDLSKYDEIVLATPVWAGKVSCFMRAFLELKEINGKTITLVATCDGGPGKVMKDYRKYIGNNTISEQLYIKGELV